MLFTHVLGQSLRILVTPSCIHHLAPQLCLARHCLDKSFRHCPCQMENCLLVVICMVAATRCVSDAWADYGGLRAIVIVMFLGVADAAVIAREHGNEPGRIVGSCDTGICKIGAEETVVIMRQTVASEWLLVPNLQTLDRAKPYKAHHGVLNRVRMGLVKSVALFIELSVGRTQRQWLETSGS